MRAEALDRAHVIIDSADPMSFYVEWKHHDGDIGKIDPIIELFRPLRDRVRKENDVHIVAGGGPWSDRKIAGGRIRRKYVLSYCLGKRPQKEVNRRMLESEFKEIQPRLLGDLQEALDAWREADNGLALFLEKGNKESIHSFLVSIGLREPEKPAPKRATKEERRQAYLKEHPEHAKTARPKPRNKKPTTKP
jgi:hypothetical protein